MSTPVLQPHTVRAGTWDTAGSRHCLVNASIQHQQLSPQAQPDRTIRSSTMQENEVWAATYKYVVAVTHERRIEPS